MAEILGVDIPTPEINLTGIISSTWIYVFIIVIIGIILITLVSVLLFFKTYNRKVVFFENISGLGYQPTVKTRARIIKLGISGEEILKTFAGGYFLTADGKKMGKRTYWFAKAQDGYFYNVVLGDIDTKLNMLDIEPVERDVRMFHVALDRLSHDTYGKTSFLQKYGIHLMLFLFLIVLIFGMWFIIGKIGKAVEPLSQTNEASLKIVEANEKVVTKLDNILRGMGRLSNEEEGQGGSGLIPVE